MKRLYSFLRAVGVLLAVGLLSASGQGLAQQPRVEHLVDDYAPSFSHYAKTIVFERLFSTLRYGVDTHPVEKRAVLLLMRADGSRKRVLRHPGAAFEYSASFSPDGRSILFARDERIYLMRRDGSGARPVCRDFLEQACPWFGGRDEHRADHRRRGRNCLQPVCLPPTVAGSPATASSQRVGTAGTGSSGCALTGRV